MRVASVDPDERKRKREREIRSVNLEIVHLLTLINECG